MKRILIAAAVAVTGTLSVASTALATYHELKIREVYAGGGDQNADFIELQMYSAGQNQVFTKNVQVYNAVGIATGYPLVSNATFGDNQRTILIGDTAVPNRDFTADVDLDLYAMNGAACYPDGQPADCVAWGNFAEQGGFPDLPAATSEIGAPNVGITGANSITRSIAPGCATLLEAGDDTGSSVGDFAFTPPSPRSNATAPTELPCLPPATTAAAPATAVRKKCKKKKRRKLAAISKKRCKRKKR
jgi:hypothetical protein